jgi:hypothetical protein
MPTGPAGRRLAAAGHGAGYRLGTIVAVATLEQRVRELTAHAVARDPSVLDATTGGAPLKGSQREVNRIVLGALSGIHEALIEIAREIDEIRSEL